MKLIKTKDRVVVEKSFPGLINAKFTHEIKGTTASCDWTGPQIDPVVWHQVLSFFKWGHTTYSSEQQIRLWVNPVTRHWGAWAFPQESRSGMATKELKIEETPEQVAARFAHWGTVPSSDWIYFATVHHHCSTSAFQSGTDQSDEKGQDGLHITIGHLGRSLYDLHARFYLREECFEPDMSLFWDVGEEAKQIIPDQSLWDRVARMQMSRPVEVPFPDVWKENVLEIKRDWDRTSIGGSHFPHQGIASYYNSNGAVGWKSNLADRADDAAWSLIEHNPPLDLKSLEEVVKFLGADAMAGHILMACKRHNIDADDLLRWWPTEAEIANTMLEAQITEQEERALDAREEAADDKRFKEINGIRQDSPDWYGMD